MSGWREEATEEGLADAREGCVGAKGLVHWPWFIIPVGKL